MREAKVKKLPFFAVALGFSTHQRLMQIGDPVRADAALAVWISVLDYTRSKELDGYCPRAVVDQPHRQQAIVDLLRVKLLTAEEKDGTHWLYLQNYELLNETKADIEKRQRQQRKWSKKNRDREASLSPQQGLSEPSVNGSQSLSQSDLKSSLRSDTRSAVSVATENVQRGKTKRGTQVPSEDAGPQELEDWCTKWDIDHSNPEIWRMLDWARAKGETCKDWGARWRNWVRKSEDMARAAPQRGRQGVFNANGYREPPEDPNSAEACARRRRERERDLLSEALRLVPGGVK